MTDAEGVSITLWCDHYDVDAVNNTLGLLAAAVGPAAQQAAELERVGGLLADATEKHRRALRLYRDARQRLAEIYEARPTRGRFLVEIDDRGGAWLLDPVKGDAGLGFRYRTLADLWADRPGLRPVEWTDGRLLVEHCPLNGGEAS